MVSKMKARRFASVWAEFVNVWSSDRVAEAFNLYSREEGG